MKTLLTSCLSFAMVIAMTGCGASSGESASAPSNEEKKEIVVFAAASMTETLDQIKVDYEKEHPDVILTYNFDSSGTLKTQIEEGATCDIFISAAQEQMDQLDASKGKEKNPESLDFIDSDTRVDLLENKVNLVVPKNNPKDIQSFDQLAELLQNSEVLLAMGNSDVPVGQYTLKIFDYYGLNEESLAAQGKLTYGSNVKEVTTQVSEASVDCGIIYATDAYSAGLKAVDDATEEMCGQVIYPAAVLKTSQHPDAAKEFLDYLQSNPASKVFEKVGFTAISK